MRNNVILFRLFLIAAISIAVLISYFKKSPEENSLYDVTELESLGPVVPMDPVSLHMAINWALVGTKYENNFSLNEQYDDEVLSIYIYDSSEIAQKDSPLLYIIKYNAVYISSLNVIAVDYQLVQKLWERYFYEDHSWGTRANLLAWIIGHEVGHMVKGHEKAHFEESSVLYVQNGCELSKEEFEADQYYAEMLYNAPEFTINAQIILFKRIIDFEIEKSVKPQTSADKLMIFLNLKSECAYPPYINRAFRFIKSISVISNDSALKDLTNHYEKHLFIND